MRKWWPKNKEEVFAGLFLLALLSCSVGMILNSIETQAARQEKTISLMGRG